MFRPQTGQQFAGFAEYKRMSVGGLIDPSLLDLGSSKEKESRQQKEKASKKTTRLDLT